MLEFENSPRIIPRALISERRAAPNRYELAASSSKRANKFARAFHVSDLFVRCPYTYPTLRSRASHLVLSSPMRFADCICVYAHPPVVPYPSRPTPRERVRALSRAKRFHDLHSSLLRASSRILLFANFFPVIYPRHPVTRHLLSSHSPVLLL